MSARVLVILTLLVLALAPALSLPSAAADAPTPPVDFRITLVEGEPPLYEGPENMVELTEAFDGERYAWRINLSKPYTVAEIVIEGAFDVERSRQVVPKLIVPHEEYPLFTPIPRHVWDVDGVPRYGLYHANGTADAFTMWLGLPGPRDDGPAAPFDARLQLDRDVVPPAISPGPIQDMTWRGFYQEATTDELALMDLVVCCDPEGRVINNPTTIYHFLHKFPIQGLDPEKTYETTFFAEDWAGNVAEAPTQTLTTPTKPVVPEPVVTPLSPAPDAKVEADDVLIEARIESPDIPLADGGIRFFLDKQEVRENLEFTNGTFRYRPATPLSPGIHSVGIEVTNAEGGEARAAWTFEVERARTPAPSIVFILAAAVMALALHPRRA